MGKSSVALHSMFEGLFVRGLHVDAALQEKLRAKGFDLLKPQARYPVTVFEDCVDAAAQALYPQLSRREAWQAIGRRFIEGYFETLVGKLISVSMPFLSPKTFINRVPRFITTGLEGALVTVEWHDARKATLFVKESGDEAGALMAGVMAVCFERMGVPAPTFEPHVRGTGDSLVVITLAP